MCGIIGSFGRKIRREHVEKILSRGKDGFGINDNTSEKYEPSLIPKDGTEGVVHLLHNVVKHILQPFNGEFVTNCEIYNWKELNNTLKLNAKNDAELLYHMIKEVGLGSLELINGEFAFIWNKVDKKTKKAELIFGRDRMGIKPLVYNHNKEGILIASEGKVLEEFNFCEPGIVYTYDGKSLTQTKQSKLNSRKGDIKKILLSAIKKRVEGIEKIGILFSGGVDSTLLAKVCKDLDKDIQLYTAGFKDGNLEEAQDTIWAKETAHKLNIPLTILNANFDETVEAIKKIIYIIESRDIIKVGVALPFYFCARQAQKDKIKVLLSGIGAEECFAGYDRHLKVLQSGGDVNKECEQGFEKIWKRDLYRDDMITMYFSTELRVPFLDKNLISASLAVPVEQKINYEQKKIILRKIAKELGIPEKVCNRKKLGAQYGSKFDRAIEKLAKRKNMLKQEWLNSL